MKIEMNKFTLVVAVLALGFGLLANFAPTLLRDYLAGGKVATIDYSSADAARPASCASIYRFSRAARSYVNSTKAGTQEHQDALDSLYYWANVASSRGCYDW